MRSPRSAHPETRDVNARAVLAFGGGLVIFILAVLVGVRFFGSAASPLAFGAGTGLFTSGTPVLQLDTRADRAAYDAEKQKRLTSAYWIDRPAGIAHIPIDDAMRIIALGGVPDWGQRTTTTKAGCVSVTDIVPRAPAGTGCLPKAAPP